MSKIGKKGKIRFSLQNFITVKVSQIGKKGNFVKSGLKKFGTPGNMSKIGKKGKIAKFESKIFGTPGNMSKKGKKGNFEKLGPITFVALVI